jgi:predicted deacetylase
MPEHPALVVTVHDVAPRTEADTAWLLDELTARGIARRALAVIPNDGGLGPIPPQGALAARVRAEAAAGNEVLLHGWTHRGEGPLRGPWADRLRGRLFARDAAELLSVSAADVRSRVVQGLGALHDLGLEGRGYLAPGWLAPPELPATLREAGMTHLVGFAQVRDLVRDRSIPAPGIGYMGAGGLHERLAALGGWAARRARPGAPVLQVYLHPAGARRSDRCRALLDTLPSLARGRTVTTFAHLVDAGRDRA